MIANSRTATAIHLVGGLLAVLVVVALPTFLGLAAPDALDASGCAGDPSAAALRSLDQSIQNSRSAGRSPDVLTGFVEALHPALAIDVDLEASKTTLLVVTTPPGTRLSPIDTRTTLTL